MFNLLKALKRIIERKVVNIQPLRADISAGDTIIPVRSAKRFEEENGQVAIYRDGEQYGEPHSIYRIIDYHTIELEEPVAEDYSSSVGLVQNLIGGENWVRAIYVGDPPVIGRYPAITIAGVNKSNEWMTIDSTKDRFNVDISVYIEAGDYEKGYEYVLNLTKSIEETLFNNFYPLVDPFCTTTLLEDVSDTDTVIRVENDRMDIMRRFLWFWLENDQHTQFSSPARYRDNGVIELRTPIGVAFSAGDDVIFPARHFFDTRPESTDFGNVVKGESLLWGSRIHYFAVEEKLRHNPFYEALNRR